MSTIDKSIIETMKYEDFISIERTFKMRMRRVGNPKSFFARLHTPFWPCFFRNMSNCHTKDFYINFASRDWGWRRPVFVVVKKCGGRKYLSLFPITTIIWIYLELLELYQWWWYVPVTWSWYSGSSQTPKTTSWEPWIWRSSLFKLDIIL